MAEQNNRTIRSLQGLRVLAFAGIFLSHAIDTPSGAWGVSIFIMLSGFVMTYAYWNRAGFGRETTVKDSVKFAIKKIRPLYPLHLIMLAAAFIPYYLVPAISSHSWRELAKAVLKLFITVPLIQTWFPVGYEAINTVAWYLSAMLFLYAAFPWLFRLLKRDLGIVRIVLIMLLVFAAQFAFALAAQHIPYLNNSHWSCYILPLFRLGDFFIGMCFGYCFIKQSRRTGAVWATVLELVFLAFAFWGMFCHGNMDVKWLTFTLIFVPSSAGIVYLLAKSEGLLAKVLSSKPLQIAASFTPYAFLIHRQVLHYCEDIWLFMVGEQINQWVLVFVAIALTVLFSYGYMALIKNKRR